MDGRQSNDELRGMMKLKHIVLAGLLMANVSAAAALPEDERLEAIVLTVYALNPQLNAFRIDVDVKDAIALFTGTVDTRSSTGWPNGTRRM